MADLSTYQTAANAVYDPQQQAEGAQLTTTKNANIATDESQKGQINTDYAAAIQNLQNTTNDNVGSINQLYTLRLGGNFSGLQGNDLGQMFARATQTQGNIEATRANKINGINTDENNVNQQFNTAYNGLGSKYSSLKADYANTNYAAAVKDEQDQAYKNAQLNLSYARLANSSANSANSQANSTSTLRSNLQADIANAFNASGAKTKSYTERVVLPALYGAYGSLGNDEINKAVYQYRQNALGY